MDGKLWRLKMWMADYGGLKCRWQIMEDNYGWQIKEDNLWRPIL